MIRLARSPYVSNHHHHTLSHARKSTHTSRALKTGTVEQRQGYSNVPVVLATFSIQWRVYHSKGVQCRRPPATRSLSLLNKLLVLNFLHMDPLFLITRYQYSSMKPILKSEAGPLSTNIFEPQYDRVNQRPTEEVTPCITQDSQLRVSSTLILTCACVQQRRHE